MPITTSGKAYEAGANEEQLAVIRHVAGPLRVLAQAGSGKTRALVCRVAALIDHGADPSRIFAVTFSKKAATEMDERLRKLGIEDVNVQTWHAFCYRVIREDLLPESRWAIDEKDQEKFLVKNALGWKGLKWDGADVTLVRRFIGHCKANLWAWDSDEAKELARSMFRHHAQTACRAYAMRDEAMAEKGLLAFDDMLVIVARHFEDDQARRGWAGRFDYVLTDEAQDNNRAQVELARALSRDHRNLMVVGDVAQAIYSFRGSKPDYLVAFKDEWQAAEVTMSSNYRSASRVVKIANEVIRPAVVRVPSDMVAAREDAGEGRASLVRAATFDDEASEVAAWVKSQKESGRSYAECTVLFRLNAQSRALEDALLREKVPYLIVGGVNFWQRKEVKDLLAYLRVAAGKDVDGDGVKRCINAPFRYLGAKFVERVMAEAGEANHDWPEIVKQVAAQEGIQQRQRASATEWAYLMRDLQEMIWKTEEAEREPTDPDYPGTDPVPAKEARPAAVLDAIVQRTRYIQWLEKEEGEESIESSHAANVREMLRVAASFATVSELLEYIDRNIRDTAKAKRAKGDRVLLMSIHRSKGLEWPCVWVVGCNEKVLPHAKGDPEEERRLAYVAVTRARDELVCSYVTDLTTRAGVSEGRLSRFFSPSEVNSIFEYRSFANPGSRAVEVVEDEITRAALVAEPRAGELANPLTTELDEIERKLSDDGCAVRFSDEYRKATEEGL